MRGGEKREEGSGGGWGEGGGEGGEREEGRVGVCEEVGGRGRRGGGCEEEGGRGGGGVRSDLCQK